jgi:flagellar hook assembly protein FlgD
LLYTCNRTHGFSIINAGMLADEDDPQNVPETTMLSCFPNPSKDSATIRFSLDESSSVKLEVYNLRGQLLRSLLSGPQASGNHSLAFDGRDEAGRPLPSGVYLIRFRVGKYIEIKKLTLVK